MDGGASAASVLNSVLRISQIVYELAAVGQQANDLLAATKHVLKSLETTKTLRREKSSHLSPTERDWIDSIIADATVTLTSVASLVEPVRVDMQTRHGKIGFVNRGLFVFRDCPKIPTHLAQLNISSGSLNTALGILCQREGRTPQLDLLPRRLNSRESVSSFATGVSQPPAYEESEFLHRRRKIPSQVCSSPSTKDLPESEKTSQSPPSNSSSLDRNSIVSSGAMSDATPILPQTTASPYFCDEKISTEELEVHSRPSHTSVYRFQASPSVPSTHVSHFGDAIAEMESTSSPEEYMQQPPLSNPGFESSQDHRHVDQRNAYKAYSTSFNAQVQHPARLSASSSNAYESFVPTGDCPPETVAPGATTPTSDPWQRPDNPTRMAELHLPTPSPSPTDQCHSHSSHALPSTLRMVLPEAHSIPTHLITPPIDPPRSGYTPSSQLNKPLPPYPDSRETFPTAAPPPWSTSTRGQPHNADSSIRGLGLHVEMDGGSSSSPNRLSRVASSDSRSSVALSIVSASCPWSDLVPVVEMETPPSSMNTPATLTSTSSVAVAPITCNAEEEEERRRHSKALPLAPIPQGRVLGHSSGTRAGPRSHRQAWLEAYANRK